MESNNIKSIITGFSNPDYDVETTCMIISRVGYIQWEDGNPIGITSDECDESVILSFKKDDVQKCIDKLPEFFINYLKNNKVEITQPILPNFQTFICRIIDMWNIHDEYFTADIDFDYFG